MNKNYIFMVLAVGTVMLTSCSDELMNDEKGGFSKPGDGIVFGANAGFELDEDEANNVKTRTIYTGETYTEGDKTFEKIHWIAGDQVSIYCNEASGSLKTLDYEVTAQNTGVDGSASENYHKTGLKPVNAESGLQWGTGNHTFYSVYPATEIEYDATKKTATVTGTVLDVQTPEEITRNNNLWTVKPNMDYAYMIAKTTANPASTSSVKLQYMPIVTAVEVTLFKSEDVNVPTINLSNIIVRSTNKTPIYGHFTVDVAGMTDSNNDGFADSIPTVTNISEANTNYMINIPMYGDYDNNGTNEALPFENGQSLTFTVFMLSNTDLTSLEISLQGIQGTKTATFSGEGFNIQKNKKTYMRNVHLPGNLSPFDQSNWIKYLEDNAIVRTLSIPGAGGAASHVLPAGKSTTVDGVTFVHDQIRQQDLSIQQLWNKGVRCFEFAVDINSDSNAGIGAKPVLSGGLPCKNASGDETTLEEAVGEVKQLLMDYPEEFAIVIITYQTLGGWAGSDNVTRNPSTFMTQVNNFWKNTIGAGTVWKTSGDIKVTTALYDPTTANVKNSRGKLFCIVRPTSIHEDYGEVLYQSSGRTNRGTGYITTKDLSALGTLTPHEHIMLIQGWGTLKDKWQQRGYSKYSIRGTAPVSDVTIDDGIWGFGAVKVGDNLPGRPFDVSSMTVKRNNTGNYYWDGDEPIKTNLAIDTTKLKANFMYDVVSGSTSKAWVQEWARVSTMENVLWFQFSTTGISKDNPGSTNGATAKTAYWAPSYEEKLKHVKDALTYSKNKTKGDIVYINSLCGYLVTEGIENSLHPCILTDRNIKNENQTLTNATRLAGMAGDIGGFAKKINKDFYNHVLTQLDENGHLSGSFGIVLMDRVSNVETDPGSLIPGIIVANNFQTSQVTPAPAATLSMPRSDYDSQNGDTPAAKTRSNGGFTVTWE